MAGAKRNAIPTCCRQVAICAAGRLIFTPKASITSAEPHFEVMLRLPCLATRTPAPATTKAVAVEMLKVPLASPPVPQVSTRASRPVPLASRTELGVAVRVEWRRREWLRQIRQFLRPSRPSCAGRRERGDLRVGALAGEDLGHHGLRASSRDERLAMIGDAMEGVEDHKIQATGERG